MGYKKLRVLQMTRKWHILFNTMELKLWWIKQYIKNPLESQYLESLHQNLHWDSYNKASIPGKTKNFTMRGWNYTKKTLPTPVLGAHQSNRLSSLVNCNLGVLHFACWAKEFPPSNRLWSDGLIHLLSKWRESKIRNNIPWILFIKDYQTPVLNFNLISYYW